VKNGLGRQVIISIERIEPVPKSAFQARGERPDAAKHFEMMRATADLSATSRITIVDDFVTKGNTLLGAASRLREAYPQGEIAVFALVRTKGLQREIDDLLEPCVGRIWARSPREADREP
jgi:adenine/guanine phosphoribosyltransferase-like PRPP-binding protein